MSHQQASKELRLARYLREFVGLRTTTIRDVSKYDTVLWLGDMPQEPEYTSPAWIDDWEVGDSWLEVHKQKLPKAPDPPELVLPWADQVALQKATEEIPRLNSVAFFPDEEAEVEPDEEPPLIQRHLDDHPEVSAAYDRFRPTWEAWAIEYRRRQRIQHVYATLFGLHTQLQKQGEIVEVVLGIGLLEWRIPVKGRTVSICRHVVRGRVDLKFDPQAGVIRLECASSGAELQIEDDMLEAESRPDRSNTAHVTEQLREIGDDVWDRELIHGALKSWAGSLHADTEWSSSLSPVRANDTRPRLTFAPAIILRKRNQRGMLRIYDAPIDWLSRESETPPAGWGGLVNDQDDLDERIDDSGNARPIQSPEETWFPLPTNREQRRIVDAIRKRRGVLVQGPPGTGKSHTIANLVCHLLATGKRLLITAETGRALQVLKDKLPEEIRPLCVCLLGQGGDSFAELNASVQEITNRYSSWHPGEHDQRIEEIDREIDGARRALAEIDTELRSLREDETVPHSLLNGSYQGTASRIAERASGERDQYDWLRIPFGSDEQPALRNKHLLWWLRVRRAYDAKTIGESRLLTVASDKLPEPSDFASVVQAERAAQDAVDRVAELQAHPAYEGINNWQSTARAALKSELLQLEELRLPLERIAAAWAADAVKDILAERRATWAALLDKSRMLDSNIAACVGATRNSVLWIADGADRRKVLFGGERKQRKVLFFTREGGDYEHAVVRRKGEELSLSERTLVDIGKKIGLEVECAKDGRVFDGNLDQYDGFALYGYDLTRDNPSRTPAVSPAGKHQLLSAIGRGKGFIGFHSAIIADRHLRERGEFDPLSAMIGGVSLGHGKQQEATMSIASPRFPGVQDLGESFTLHEEWHALTNFADDLHVILSQETNQMKGPGYERPRFPATWARMHGKGRVFYTSMGHRGDVWSHEIFRQIV